jgi:hypothetical protein
MAFRPMRAKCGVLYQSSGDDFGRTPRIYGYQKYQSKGAAGLTLVPPVAVHEDRRDE